PLAAQVAPPGDVPPVAAAEQAHRQLGAAGTHEARDADDLAGPDVEARAVDDHAPGLGGVVHRPVLDPEHLLPDLRRPLGVAVLEVAADHRADDPLLGGLRAAHVERLDGAPVAQHGGAVGDRGDLPELVGDDDARDALPV